MPRDGDARPFPPQSCRLSKKPQTPSNARSSSHQPPPPSSNHQKKTPPQLEEADIIEKLERICAPLEDAGEWATRVDFVEAGGGARLKVTDTGKPSRCNSECATAARACERAVESLDLSDVSEALYRGRPVAEVAAEACGAEGDGAGRACSVAAPPVARGRKAGPKHEPMGERELSVAKMMRQLKASGMGGQMYDRESLMKNKKMMKRMAAGGAGGGGDEDDDEDDEDEDEGEGGGGFGGGGGGGRDAGAPSAAPSVKAALGAGAAKVDEIAAKAKDTLGGAIGWLKGKVAGGAGAAAAAAGGGGEAEL